MQLPQIRMQSTSVKMEILKTPGHLEIEQPPAALSFQQQQPELNIETTPGRLTIDQTEAWANMDLKNVFRRIEEYAQEGKQAWLQALEKTVAEGKELMMIENGGNPLAAQAKRNSQPPDRKINTGGTPSPFSVKVHYEPGQVRFDPKTYKAITDIQPNQPRIHYTPGKVNTDIAQYPSLKFDVER